MINCIDISLAFGSRSLFKNINLNLSAKNRYALVGANGTGKSTLLKLLAGEEQPSDGTIEKPKSARIGLLKQDHFLYKDHRVIDVVIDGKPELAHAIKEKDRLLAKTTLTDEENYLLAELEETILLMDGYNAESEASTILKGLGIPHSKHNGPLSELSGGYKLRVLLAQSLFKNPDILLLDEPTNHLDIVSIQWLAEFLTQEYKGLLIFVSHDRQFIDDVATHILDLDYQTVSIYPENYQKFLIKKEEKILQLESEIAHKQQQIDSMQEFVDRFGAKASKAKQAQARIKMIEKIEDDMPEAKTSSRIEPYFNFQQKSPSGKKVLEVKGIAKSFVEKLLFQNANFNLNRGQRYALIGPNGIGKSTLLKIVLDQIKADQGEYSWNDNVSIGYFAQDFHHFLVPEKTLLQWLMDEVANVSELNARKVLGQMLFSGDDAKKKINVLSGGECARLYFAKLMLQQHNVLILDEPTNHLDLEAIDGLAKGLKKFPGTVFFVSHNRYFVQEVANHLIIINANRITTYPGTYQEYLDKMGRDYLIELYAAKMED